MENFADYIDGFMTGAVKYKPYVLLSATSLNGELTLSMCVRGNEKDKTVVEKFLWSYGKEHKSDYWRKNINNFLLND